MEGEGMEAPADLASFASILPLNQQLEMWQPEEDWSGLANSAQRRKLQNRLHQRAWRRRRARQAIAPATTSAPAQKQEIKHQIENPPRSSSSDPPSMKGNSICTLGASLAKEMLIRFEESAYQQYLLGSPRTDLLLTLVKFNVFRALLDNTRALGFTIEWLNGDAISPFTNRKVLNLTDESLAMSTCPRHLKPTELQCLVEHHPWIDLFPIPKMRENILRADGYFDEEALCHDMVEICGSLGEQSGLIVWGDPWDLNNWEIGEDFLKKWAWIIEDCWELFSATNHWRTLRGEDKLFSDTACTPQAANV